MVKINRNLLFYGLILLAILTRFVPHPPNFTALGAIALFSGTYLPKRWSFLLIILAMLISDAFLGFYNIWIMFSVYGSFAIIAALGWYLKNKAKGVNVLGLSLFSSTIFYLVTNFAVWAAQNMYPKNLAGFFQCYYLAIPFFRNMLFGDLFYVIILFGTYALMVNTKRLRLSSRFSMEVKK